MSDSNINKLEEIQAIFETSDSAEKKLAQIEALLSDQGSQIQRQGYQGFLFRVNNMAGLLRVNANVPDYVRVVADTLLAESEALINKSEGA